VVILNDAAGDAKDEGRSYRGGASWLYTAGQVETPWAQYRWHYETQCQGRHSTLLEMVNGNMSLGAVVQDYPGYDIIEVYDNQAVTALCRSLASSKPDMSECLEHSLATVGNGLTLGLTQLRTTDSNSESDIPHREDSPVACSDLGGAGTADAMGDTATESARA